MADVAVHVDGRGPSPASLDYFRAFQTWGVLPEGGGLRDQPAGELRRMADAGTAERLWRLYRTRSRGWDHITADGWRVIQMIAYLLVERGDDDWRLRRLADEYTRKRPDGI